MYRVSGKSSALPNKTALFGEERWDFAADEFVRDRLLAVRVELVCVLDFPGTASGAVVVRHGFTGRGELGLLRVEGVSVLVLCTANLSVSADCIDLEDGVVRPVDVGVNA